MQSLLLPPSETFDSDFAVRVHASIAKAMVGRIRRCQLQFLVSDPVGRLLLSLHRQGDHRGIRLRSSNFYRSSLSKRSPASPTVARSENATQARDHL
jgi:hypothetical protein